MLSAPGTPIKESYEQQKHEERAPYVIDYLQKMA